MKPRHKRFVLVAAGVAALGGAAALILNAFQSNLVFFYTPTQVAAAEAPQGRQFRIGGLVQAGSVQRLADGVTVHRFHADLPRLLAQSDAVVGMAGYNTVCEILQSRTPAVLLPRTFPRREQLIRAERLERLGLCETLARPTAAGLLAAVERALARGRLCESLPPLDGRERLCAVAAQLVAERAGRAADRPIREAAGSDR